MSAIRNRNFQFPIVHSFLGTGHLYFSKMLSPNNSHPDTRISIWHYCYRSCGIWLGVGAIALTSLSLGITPAVAQLTVSQSPNSARAMSQINVLYVNPATGDDTQGKGTERSPLKTITQALRTAQPNTVILLSPGIYSPETGETFPLVMKLGVTIQGNPRTRGQDIVIRGGATYLSPTANSQNITILGANQAGLTGVTVTNPNPQGYGLWIEGSSPLVVDNTFTGNTKGGIYVNGNSAPTIRSNYFYNNGGDGITASGTLQPEVRENVFANDDIGFTVGENAVPVVMNLPSRPDVRTAVQSEDNRPRGNSQPDTSNQTFAPRLITFGNQLRSSIESRTDVTQADQDTTQESTVQANSASPSPSSETNPRSAPVRITSPSSTENKPSVSVAQPTPTNAANVSLEPLSTVEQTAANPGNANPTEGSQNIAKTPTPTESVSPQPAPDTNSSATRISAASFPVPTLLRSRTSSSNAGVSSTPAPSSTLTPLTSTPVAPTQTNLGERRGSSRDAITQQQSTTGNQTSTTAQPTSPQPQLTSQAEDDAQVQGVEIPVPQPDSTAQTPTTTPSASSQTINQDNQSTLPEPNSMSELSRLNSSSQQNNPAVNSPPVRSNNTPLSNLGERQTTTTATSTAGADQGQRYRVLVEADSDTQQNLVRSLVPGAFRTSFNGQTMMQAGIFSTLEKADAMRELLQSKGLIATVEPAN